MHFASTDFFCNSTPKFFNPANSIFFKILGFGILIARLYFSEVIFMKKLAVVINPKDNVATAVQDLKKGQEVNVDLDGKIVKVNLLDDIPFGHKFALVDIDLGKEVIKYGEVIGRTTRPIKTGEHVHVHNFESLRGRGDWEEEGR